MLRSYNYDDLNEEIEIEEFYVKQHLMGCSKLSGLVLNINNTIDEICSITISQDCPIQISPTCMKGCLESDWRFRA